MLIKIIGCALIVFSAIYCGVLYVSSIKKRIRALGFFIKLFEMFKIKLEYEFCTFPQLFESVHVDSEFDDFTVACFTKIRNGESLCDAWIKSAEEKADKFKLFQSDVLILKQFSQELGRTDLSGQISNLSMYIEILKKVLSEADEQSADKSKIAINTSVFAGLIISILLI